VGDFGNVTLIRKLDRDFNIKEVTGMNGVKLGFDFKYL
jgi:hypothetical protein